MKITLFDLDHTLLPVDSDHTWGQFTTELGWTDAQVFAQANDVFYAHYQAGTLNIHEYVRFATRALRLQGPQAAALAHERFMREKIWPCILPQAQALVQAQQEASDVVMLVTATNEFVTRPIAKALGISELIAVNLARDANGWITGEIEGVPSFQAGKVERVHQWLQARGLSWGDVDVAFYSDSMNDLPLLEKAHRPVATNPDARLRQLALDRGWPTLDLF